jgi:hypothetical protein
MEEENYKGEVKEKLKKYRREDIIITDHAKKQAFFRGIELEEIRKNILNPERLEIALKQPAKRPHEEKFDCYFGYSKTQAHRYILVLGNKVIIPTVIKINRRWQRKAEKHGKF